MTEERPEHRLDPDRAASEALRRAGSAPEPVIDTRPYRRMIGAIGIGIAVVISALLVGVVRGMTIHFIPAAGEASMYVLMFLVLLFRPRGLLGERIEKFET